jgi:putative intracellular protease/amidase
MKKKTVLLFVFDGFSDWEMAYAAVGIRKSGVFKLITLAMQKEPVETMGGLTVVPDLDFFHGDLQDIDASNTAMLLLPGGDAWMENGNDEIVPLIRHCLSHGIPVAAICGASIFLARLGLLNTVDHTSNDLEFLIRAAPAYRGSPHFKREPSVSDAGIITAGGTAPIEFAAHIFETLGIADDEPLKQWFQYFGNNQVSSGRDDQPVVVNFN